MALSGKKLAVAYFYSQIKGFMEGFIGNMGFTISSDLAMVLLGYYADKKGYWWGEPIAYAAVAKLGETGGFALSGLFGGAQAQAQARAPATYSRRDALRAYIAARWGRG